MADPTSLPSLVAQQSGVFLLTGPLGFETVMGLASAGRSAIAGTDDKVIFDLSKVTSVSSAGLALLVSWLRFARILGKQLTFTHTPDNLIGLARVSGMSDLLLENPA